MDTRRVRWRRRRLALERAVLGWVMGVLAFVIERALVRWSRKPDHSGSAVATRAAGGSSTARAE